MTSAIGTALRHRTVVVSATLLIVIALFAILGPLVSPNDYAETNFDLLRAPPTWSGLHIFGTDNLGRDQFVRTMLGVQVTLAVAVIASLVSLVIGVVYGAVAGLAGGRVDALMMRFVDTLYALPFIFFVILLMVVFDRNFLLVFVAIGAVNWLDMARIVRVVVVSLVIFLVILLMVVFERNLLLVFVAIGAINWLDMARIVRGQTLSLKEREFVEAARLSGVSMPGIIFRHIAPNLIGIVIVYVTLTIPQAILMESFLSFLGLGIQEPRTSLGALVENGVGQIESASWLLLIPASLLALVLLCFNFLGDGLRDLFDSRSTS